MSDASTQDFWQLGASLSIPLSTGGATRGKAKQAQAVESTAAYSLSQSTLVAMSEVEDALAQERERTLALAAQTQQLEAAREAAQQARARYAQGLNDYLTVLTALNTAQRAELEVINSRRSQLDARIQLHAALGDTAR